LAGDTLICPWHGYQYNVTNGQLIEDPSAKLATYPVEVEDGEVRLRIPLTQKEPGKISSVGDIEIPNLKPALQRNEFSIREVMPGHTKLVTVKGEPVSVYNVNGEFYATHNTCTHAGGPLNEGDLSGREITCPWHGSCFDVTNGKVLCGPATEPVRTYRVLVDGEIGRVEE
jgi:nitrite reductase/ring-hydroxylating ferredoxin subunit